MSKRSTRYQYQTTTRTIQSQVTELIFKTINKINLFKNMSSINKSLETSTEINF